MGEKNYKKDEPIEVTYQAPGNETAIADVTMTIFDETNNLDGVNFADVVLVEQGTTGVYDGEFTPDAEGEWRIVIAFNSKTQGSIVKQFSVGNFNVDDIGASVTIIQAAVGAIDAPPMIG